MRDLINRISQITRSHLENARGSHRWDHTLRVYRLAVHLAKETGADQEIVGVAALLHDIGRAEEDENKGEVCHAEKGAEIGREILFEEGLSKDKVEKVVHCIATHRFRGDKTPQSLEARVLFDADKLDSIGAVGIGRAFLFAGEVGAKLHDKNIDVHQTKPYTEEDTAYREFLVKLQYVKDRMLTDQGLRLAKERHRYMIDFFNRLNQEVDGEL